MDSIQFLWEMGRAWVQLAVALWPVTVILAASLLFRGSVYLYKTRRYAKAGIADVDRLSGQEFEHYLEVLFKRLGYQVQRTPYQGDFGADLVLRQQGDVKTVVQAKRYHRRVGVKAIQEAVASKQYYHADNVMVVTNSSFTRQAEALAKANRVELWDRDTLVARLIAGQETRSAEFAATTEGIATEPVGVAPAQQDSTTSVCATCGKPVSAKVHAYCVSHPETFDGLTYCYEHQKERRSIHAPGTG